MNEPKTTVAGDSTPVQTPTSADATAELQVLRERLASLESSKAVSDLQAAESARVVKIANAKAHVIAKHLAGDYELESYLPNTDDPATLEASAVKLQLKFRAIRPDFGNASGKDGGTVPGRGHADHKSTPASQLISMGFKPR